MSLDSDEKAFVAATKHVLEETARDLDVDIAGRLRQARVCALEARPKPLRWLLPASGFAAASVALLAVALWFFQPTRPTPIRPAPMQGVEDLEILTSTESLELFDDLEFYHWLAEQEPAS